MSSLVRKMKRQHEKEEERKEIKNIKDTFGKTPKVKCPKCKKRTLFYTNEHNDIYCVRCEQRIGNRSYIRL